MSGMTSGRAALAALTLAAVLGTTAALSAVRPHSKSAVTPVAARGQLMVFGGRSAAQQQGGSGAKFDAALAALARNARAARPGVSAGDLRSLNPAARFAVSKTTGDSYIAIDAVTRADPQALKTALVRLGLVHPAVFLNDVGGWLPLRSLNAAAALAGLNSIRASMSRLNAGAVTSQGDYVQGTSALRSSTGLDGTGITVGVLSDSYNCYATYAQDGIPASGVTGYASNGFKATATTDIASGDLPASSSINILEEAGAGPTGDGLCSYDSTYDLPNGDEGRAMLQIVHDVAPGAHLAFYTAVNSEADMASGIKALAGAGAKIIADDVTYFDEPFFQDGLIAQAIDSVNASGVAYFAAAGNNGAIGYDNLAPNFATHSVSPASELLMNFDTTGATTTTAMTATIPPLPPGDFVAIVLEWDQPYVTGSPDSGGATSQMDLCFTGSGVGLIASPINPDDPDGGANTTIGTNTQVCTGANSKGVDPYQILVVGYPASATNGPACPSGYGLPAGATCSATQNITIQVGLAGGTTPHRIKLVIEDNGAGVLYPGPIVPAGGTLQGHPGAAGAIAVGAAFWQDTPLCGATPAQLESFSAKGGDPILFDATGAALATAVTRQKPDLVGPDGVSNTFLGFAEGVFGSGACANTSYPNFFGTSAATPHVAATAALLLQRNPNATPAQLYAALQKTAAPMSSSAPDYLNGYGFIQADAAVSQIPTAPDVTLNLDPTTINVGQSAALTWTVTNATSCTASGAWSGNQGLSGSLTVKPSAAGSYSYVLTCVNANGKTVDTDVLTVVTPSSGGGGGALDLVALALLGGFAGARLRRRART